MANTFLDKFNNFFTFFLATTHHSSLQFKDILSVDIPYNGIHFWKNMTATFYFLFSIYKCIVIESRGISRKLLHTGFLFSHLGIHRLRLLSLSAVFINNFSKLFSSDTSWPIWTRFGIINVYWVSCIGLAKFWHG